jgi:hypothetical protein
MRMTPKRQKKKNRKVHLMSYDIYITAADETVYDRNYTSNVAGIWDRAMPDLNLRDMKDQPASVCLPHLTKGVCYLIENRERLQGMAPNNNWGCVDGAMSVLAGMAAACAQHPTAVVKIHN